MPSSIRSAEVIKELKRIASKNAGCLRPQDIVKAASSRTSVLHELFEWDDTEAARAWRVHQARMLLNVVVEYIGPKDEEREERVYVSLRNERDGDSGYRSLVDVLSDEQLRAQLLRDAFEELEHFKKRYKNLKELAEVFAAIDHSFERRDHRSKNPDEARA